MAWKRIVLFLFIFSVVAEATEFKIDKISDLDAPWGSTFISSKELLITEKSGKIKLVGVTTLTSLDDKSIKEIGFSKKIKDLVVHQAKLAKKVDLDAIVCGAKEISLVKKIFKKEIITPGIRLPGDNKGDQKRVMTPREAFKQGSDWIVIGRDLTKGNIKGNFKKLSDHLSQ